MVSLNQGTDQKHFHSPVSFQTQCSNFLLNPSIYLKPLSTRVYNTLVILKLLPPLPPRTNAFEDLENQNDQVVIPTSPLPITHDEVFEVSQADAQKRRKELAQKALEARLLQKQQK